MTLQNRVTPFGEITAQPWRGALMGNRGCLHDTHGRLGVRRWRHQTWVCCLTEFRGRHRDPMPPGRYTALFFWDEAAALAAGHRPCGECRRADYAAFMAAWATAGLPGQGPREIDKHLHRARVTRRREQVRFPADPRGLPDGVFVTMEEAEHLALLIWRRRLWAWVPEDGGYADAGALPARVTVLTPRPVVEVLRAGYVPEVALTGAARCAALSGSEPAQAASAP